jgi:opacity protein-like surface antigen
MKHLAFLFLLLLVSSCVFAQRKADIGLIGGTSYYQGDINPSRLFYKPRYNVGPIFRYNFNSRYSVRLQAIYANVAGDVADFDYVVPAIYERTSFNAHFINFSTQVEYNFFEYISGINPGDWTPYMFGGFGYSLLLSPGLVNSPVESTMGHFTLPFGIGAKANITRRLSAGLEWSYNKTFNDRLDGVVSPINPSEETIFNNNDWFSFFNLFITYKFFKFAADCPAYD